MTLNFLKYFVILGTFWLYYNSKIFFNRYETSDGTAVAGEDYTSKKGSITFKPNVKKHQVDIAILDDYDLEKDEEFIVILSVAAGVKNVYIGKKPTSTITIVNDDGKFWWEP